MLGAFFFVRSQGEINMPNEVKGQKLADGLKDGPVKPGSVLHRILELIARRVAKSLRTKSTENHSAQRPQRH